MRCNLRPNMVTCPLSPGKGLQFTNLSEWTLPSLKHDWGAGRMSLQCTVPPAMQQLPHANLVGAVSFRASQCGGAAHKTPRQCQSTGQKGTERA